jgi:Siphovirus-type tail component, C-terminal domain
MGCWNPRLTAAGMSDLVFSTANGWRVESVDIGSPVTAAVVVGRPGQSGTINRTQLYRDRAVTLRAWLVPTDGIVRRTMIDQLKAFLRPDLRPYLVLTEDSTDPTERRIALVADQWSDPILPVDLRSVIMSWRSAGDLEATTQSEAIAYVSGSGAEAGRAYDLTFNRTYPASPVLGSVQVINLGNVDVWPLIRIYGDCTEPNLENQTTGKKLEFNSLTLAVGEFLEIDTLAKTVRLNALSTSSRYDKLDFAVSAPGLDLRIVPGLNLFRFYPATSGATSKAQILWRSAWL